MQRRDRRPGFRRGALTVMPPTGRYLIDGRWMPPILPREPGESDRRYTRRGDYQYLMVLQNNEQVWVWGGVIQAFDWSDLWSGGPARWFDNMGRINEWIHSNRPHGNFIEWLDSEGYTLNRRGHIVSDDEESSSDDSVVLLFSLDSDEDQNDLNATENVGV